MHAGEKDIPQLLMLLLGQGGTGKSLDIGAITESFEFHNQTHLLAKCGTSGISASDIGGQTIHSWAGISIKSSKSDNWYEKSSSAIKHRRIENILGVLLLIVDEVSMFTKTTLYYLSSIAGIARGSEALGGPADPFGGMHVILCGDFHQFPPIGLRGALYRTEVSDDSKSRIGQEIYKQFNTVIILKQQMRVTDIGWTDILNRLRVGECTKDDLDEINKLVLTNPCCHIPDFSAAPWKECTLITPRHAVREQWNSMALRKHCQQTGNILYIAPAEDTLKQSAQPVPLPIQIAVARMSEKQTGKLSEIFELAIGMKAMVTTNISTQGDIANGTRGIITEITLDPRETQSIPNDDGIIYLKYPPIMILFKPHKETHLLFAGIPPGLVPLTPSAAAFTVSTGNKSDRQTCRIHRRQYSLTAAYAFTDYKSQGQTMENVIVDIGKDVNLTPFHVYVALSRSRGRDNIRLLRSFKEELFTTHPSEDLRAEMKRLELLDYLTKQKHMEGL